MAGASVSILDVLRGKSQGLLSDDSLQLVCYDRGYDPTDVYYDLDEKDKDLIDGQLYFYMYNLSTGGSTEKVADGGWSHSESIQVSKSDADRWGKLHRMLFRKWGLEPLIPASGIRLINF